MINYRHFLLNMSESKLLDYRFRLELTDYMIKDRSIDGRFVHEDVTELSTLHLHKLRGRIVLMKRKHDLED